MQDEFTTRMTDSKLHEICLVPNGLNFDFSKSFFFGEIEIYFHNNYESY